VIGVLVVLLILAGGAVGSVALARRPRAALSVSMAAGGVAGLLCCGLALQALLSGASASVVQTAWRFPLGSIALALDGLSAWFLLLIGMGSLAAAPYAWAYYRDAAGREPVWAAGALQNALLAALVLTVCAADVIPFLVGWEAMSLSAFLLVGLRHREPQARRGAWVYLVATHVGTALGVLPLFGALAARAGTTAFAGFPTAHAAAGPLVGAALFLLGLLGFGTKAGIMPMHVWLPEAHPVAPSPVSALLSGVVIKMGVYGLLRLLCWLPAPAESSAYLVVVLAAVTGVMGILYALPQRQYKRMLAYSSIENVGVILLGIGLGMLGRALHQPVVATLGFGGALLHVLNHSLFKGLLFLSAGAVLHGTGVEDMERLGGLARRDPINAGLFAFGCAAICALPPLNGFAGEFLIYSGLIRSAALGAMPVAALALLGVLALALIGGLALAAFVKLFAVLFLGEPRDERVHAHPTPAPMLAGMFVPAAGCVVVAIAAPLVVGLLRAPLAPLLGETVDDRTLSDAVIAPLAWVSAVFVLALAVIAALVALRRRLARVEPAAAAPVTWACGYAAPTPRMQYTGSSLVWKLALAARPLLRVRREVDPPHGCFAAKSALKTDAVDPTIEVGYRTLFRLIARACERLWPLQHGRIQLYLVYIVATLLLVFAAEAWWSPFSNDTTGASAPAAAIHPDETALSAQTGGAAPP
jgi:hydrogenase-4 component B